MAGLATSRCRLLARAPKEATTRLATPKVVSLSTGCSNPVSAKAGLLRSAEQLRQHRGSELRQHASQDFCIELARQLLKNFRAQPSCS
jgi:hypothetical protein